MLFRKGNVFLANRKPIILGFILYSEPIELSVRKGRPVVKTDCTFTSLIKQLFDRSTVIFKLKSKIFACAQRSTIDYKNANETLTKTLKYLHRNSSIKLRHE